MRNGGDEVAGLVEEKKEGILGGLSWRVFRFLGKTHLGVREEDGNFVLLKVGGSDLMLRVVALSTAIFKPRVVLLLTSTN